MAANRGPASDGSCRDTCSVDADCFQFYPGQCEIFAPAVIEAAAGETFDFTIDKIMSSDGKFGVACDKPTFSSSCSLVDSTYTELCTNANGVDCNLKATVRQSASTCTINVICNNTSQTVSCSAQVRIQRPRPTVAPTRVPSSVPTAAPTAPACTISRGDANKDGRIDLVDFAILRDEILGRLTTKRADFNCDRKVNLVDFAVWRASKR